MQKSEELPLALVIDDDAMTRLLLGQTLDQEGFEVSEAEDGETGLEFCWRRMPDVVLLDVVMPGIDGFEVCEKIRTTLDGIKQIPIIMLTGLDDIESINRAYTVGATDFVVKPINWTILGHRLRYILRASQAFEKLAKSEARLTKAQRMAKLVSWDLNTVTGSLQCTDGMDFMLGRQSAAPLRHQADLFELVIEEDQASVSQAFHDLSQKRKALNTVFRVTDAAGQRLIFHAQADPQGDTDLLSGTFQDITERQHAEERIRYLSSFDELTGLPNRTLFKEVVAQAIARARRNGLMVAGLFLDLDKFQRINDTFGPSVGDKLLVMVAERLLLVVRDYDYIARAALFDALPEDVIEARLSRLGGDEFSVLLVDIHKIEDAARIARRLLETLETPFSVDDQDLFVSASIGITLFPDDSSDLDTFLRNGDSAMNFAKEQGRNNYQFFSRSLNTAAFERLSLENQLRRALDNQELVLYYQPKIEACSGKMIGVEALIRWKHPEMGLVPPIQFIPIAEESGLIIPMGEWVIREACRQSKEWASRGIGPLTMAINLSAQQFRMPDICGRTAEILQDMSIVPDQIEFELTESMLVDDVEKAIHKMNQFKEQGIRLSIDDFGTGYSSLSYLMRFPLETLKVDRSFVHEITSDRGNASITSAIIGMAKSLDLTVVAEGVENEQQIEWLSRNQCDIFQGYYFSPPLPADALVECYMCPPWNSLTGRPQAQSSIGLP